jgi:hypothetical protein
MAKRAEFAEAPKPPEKRPGKQLLEIEKAKNDATGKASDVGRQLAFAGIATIWLLRDEHGARPFETGLLTALTLLAAALLIDFLQYVYCSWVWRQFYNQQYDEHNSDEALVDIPDGLAASIYRFFWTKIIALLLGYVFLLVAAVTKFHLI